MVLRSQIGLVVAAAALTLVAGCAMPVMDAAAGFVRSGAGRPSQTQIADGFAIQRSQPAYSRGIVPSARDPLFGDQAPFWFGRQR